MDGALSAPPCTYLIIPPLCTIDRCCLHPACSGWNTTPPQSSSVCIRCAMNQSEQRSSFYPPIKRLRFFLFVSKSSWQKQLWCGWKQKTQRNLNIRFSHGFYKTVWSTPNLHLHTHHSENQKHVLYWFHSTDNNPQTLFIIVFLYTLVWFTDDWQNNETVKTLNNLRQKHLRNKNEM